jgi:type IX secretion system substrate protein
MENCMTYTLELAASDPDYGYYNWSNGDTGQLITVTTGGPYRVWFTESFGCISHSDIFVPKDPREYMWIFPTGCYRFCTFPQTLVGPIQWFNYWAYQYAPYGPILSSGSGPVGPFLVPGPGDYDMILDNGLCRDTSGIMEVSDSVCGGCSCLDVKLTEYVTACNPPRRGCCMYYISMCIDNHCEKVTATVNATSGTLTPPVIGIPTGHSCDTFLFTPGGAFTGGWVYITISWTDASGKKIKCRDSVFVPRCGSGTRPGNEPGQGSEPDLNEGSPTLTLVPNPAQNSTSVDYITGYTQDSYHDAVIQVYDMTGRMVSSYTITSMQGSWQLSLADYPAGVYLVALKENGMIVKQSKLSVIK